MIDFDGTGPLAAALRAIGRNPRPRAIQREYADAVRHILDSGRPGFLDAATGTGKTLGYLIPAIERAADMPGDPLIVVSTASIALQKQILRDDIPVALDAAARAGIARPEVALRVGRGQMVSITALNRSIVNHAREDEAERAAEVVSWVTQRYRDGVGALHPDLSERFQNEDGTLPAWLSRDLVSASASEADPHSDAFYQVMREKTSASGLLIVNHHLLALHLLRSFLWDEDRQVIVIIDEADRLPQVVEQICRSQVSLVHMRSRLRRLGAAGVPAATLASELAVRLSSDNLGHAAFLRFSRIDRGTAADLAASLGDLRLATETAIQASGAAHREITAELGRDLDALASIHSRIQIDGGLRVGVVWSPVRAFPSLLLGDRRDAMLIGRRLDGRDPMIEGAVFTSATLSASSPRRALSARGEISDFLKDCGFRRDDVPEENCAILSPARFGRMDFVRPDFDAPPPFPPVDAGDAEAEDLDTQREPDPEALRNWVRTVNAAAAREGRTLVLAASMSDVAILGREMAHLGDRLVVQSPGFVTRAAIQRFMDRPDSVWISASVWEGMSLPGAISHIVIPRIPIRPDTTEDRLLEEFIADVTGSASRGRAATWRRRQADAVRRLRQGIGRGIRKDDDEVTVWLCDGRWPWTQTEMDEKLQGQPKRWSIRMLDAVPQRFRKKHDASPRLGHENASREGESRGSGMDLQTSR